MASEEGGTGATADGAEGTGRKPVRRRADASPRTTAPVSTASPASSYRVRKPSKRTLATWCSQLERQGFTPSEARRLVFEKAHPRDEGLTRN